MPATHHTPAVPGRASSRERRRSARVAGVRRALKHLTGAAAAVAVCVSPVGVAAAAPPPGDHPSAPGRPSSDQTLEALAKLPLTFVANQGQTDRRVRYHAQGADYAFALTPEQIVMSFAEDVPPSAVAGATTTPQGGARGVSVALRFLGANPDVQIVAQGATGTRVNYVRGSDPQDWHTGLPGYDRVVYQDLWPGVDMVVLGEQGELKYEFRLQPGTGVEDIRLTYDGAQRLRLGEDGDLLVKTPIGELQDSAPVSYQEVNGVRVPVESRFLLGPTGNRYGFATGSYDTSRELVIDPALSYSTFVGGSSMDRAEGVAVDASGNAVVVGATQSTDFPTTPGAPGTTFRGGIMDAYVAKLDADGSGLVYATYLGGTPTPTRRGNVDHTETARAVTVDASGNAYVTGQTSSGDFPTTSGALQGSLSVGEQTATDAFVTKLSPTGELAYSTFLGGAPSDDGRSIAVDASGNAYVGGSTFSADFPTTTGAFDTTHNGGEDGYVAKLDPTGSSLVYSTFLGGADNELPDGVAVDSSGNAYLAGSTRSVGYPTTAGSVQPAHSGGEFADLFEGFVTKLNPSGSGLVYSTFLGGTRIDRIGDLAVDPSGNAHVVGATRSPEFPTTPGTVDTTFDGTSEGFVAKLDTAGSALAYSTFFRGGSNIALDAAGNAWLAGGTAAGAPTTADAVQPQNNGANDAYLAQLDPTASTVLHATYLGGSDNEGASGIALDGEENIYIAGTTMSADFPTTPGASDRVWDGDASIFWGDAFVAAFTTGQGGPRPGDTTPPSVRITSPADGATVSGTVPVAADASDDVSVTGVRFSVDGAPIGTDSTAPYAVSWDTTGTADGPRVITAQAVDAAGNTGNAQAVTVTVDNPVQPVTTTFTGQIDKNATLLRSLSSGVGAVDWTLSWVESRVDLDLRGRDPNGDVVFFDGGSARPKSGTFTATVPGDHTFQVMNNTDRRTNYTLSVTHPPRSASPPPSDTVAPTVAVTRPDAQSTVSGTVPVTADASDDVGVARVEFLVDDSVVIATDTTAPYETSWDTTVLVDGPHAVTARAFDGAGNASAHRIPVTVDNTVQPPPDTTAPSVSISAPLAGATVSGTVSVQADASDDVGVTAVQFLVDGTSIGTDDSAPYAVSWDTTTTADGSRTLTAVARDAAGNVGSAEQVTVTVSNQPADEPVTSTLSGRIDKNQTLSRTLAAGAGTVQWTLSWDESRVDLDLRGRDPNGNVVFFDGGSARPKSGSFPATIAGTYTFQIINNTDRDTDYTLTVTHLRP